MSTFNKVFTGKIYEKGKEITTESFKGDDGKVLSNDITKGDTGDDGKLKMTEILTTVIDTTITIPNPVDSNVSVYRIKKPANTYNDLLVVNHSGLEFTKMYKEYEQTLTLYKRDNEWVL
jgi:hypothetical protein